MSSDNKFYFVTTALAFIVGLWLGVEFTLDVAGLDMGDNSIEFSAQQGKPLVILNQCRRSNDIIVKANADGDLTLYCGAKQ